MEGSSKPFGTQRVSSKFYFLLINFFSKHFMIQKCPLYLLQQNSLKTFFILNHPSIKDNPTSNLGDYLVQIGVLAIIYIYLHISNDSYR